MNEAETRAEHVDPALACSSDGGMVTDADVGGDEQADAVIGSRFLSASHRRVLYFWHSVGNRLLTLLKQQGQRAELAALLKDYAAGQSPETLRLRALRVAAGKGPSR